MEKVEGDVGQEFLETEHLIGGEVQRSTSICVLADDEDLFQVDRQWRVVADDRPGFSTAMGQRPSDWTIRMCRRAIMRVPSVALMVGQVGNGDLRQPAMDV
jgi:hypothetical protein